MFVYHFEDLVPSEWGGKSELKWMRVGSDVDLQHHHHNKEDDPVVIVVGAQAKQTHEFEVEKGKQIFKMIRWVFEWYD